MDAERIAAIRAMWVGSDYLSREVQTDLADLLAEVERLRCLLAASLLGDLEPQS